MVVESLRILEKRALILTILDMIMFDALKVEAISCILKNIQLLKTTLNGIENLEIKSHE